MAREYSDAPEEIQVGLKKSYILIHFHFELDHLNLYLIMAGVINLIFIDLAKFLPPTFSNTCLADLYMVM